MQTQNVSIDFGKTYSKMKPMHAVNNGPAGQIIRGTSNADDYKAAGIPYARLHDSAWYYEYGGEFTVDVHRIFRNFDADENNPASYFFSATDKYLTGIDAVGTKIYYRLGAMIEHYYPSGTFPPKDFGKWARICEHIIRHYTQGWANGFHFDIDYWEIWNEPDNGRSRKDGYNPCWQGTSEQFNNFFITAIKHLKSCFPKLKFGGPAFAHLDSKGVRPLLAALQQQNIKLDFFSFHVYTSDPNVFTEQVDEARKLLDEFGFKNTELHLNEWNYFTGWHAEDFIYSVKMGKGLKGSSFIAAVMSLMQYSKLDMLMYYDARPSEYCGLFDSDILTPRKGYYSLKMFNELYKLGNCAAARSDCDKIYACAAKSKTKQAVMLTYFDDNDDAQEKAVRVELNGLEANTPKKVKIYLLDANNDLTLLRDETTVASDTNLYLNMKLFDSYLITIDKA